MSLTLDPLIGTYIGPYLVKSFIGRGGMGSVYKAYQESLDRSVAIKLLSATGPLTQEQLHRFRAEARSASKCKHANIITVYDFGVHQEHTPYMAMEFLEGESLQSLMKRQKYLTLTDVIQLLTPVASALQVIHRQGMIHRDIKPGNIFIERSNDDIQVKLNLVLAFITLN